MTIESTDASDAVRSALSEAGISRYSLSIKRFPNETIYVIETSPDLFDRTVAVANQVSAQIDGGFVTVKRALTDSAPLGQEALESLSDSRITSLIELLNARSRTSEQQPSLKYIKDVSTWLNVCVTPRHNLIFGRRGVGKTALMLEAKRKLEEKHNATFWINIQTLRGLDAPRGFLNVLLRLCDLPSTALAGYSKAPKSVEAAKDLRSKCNRLLDDTNVERPSVSQLVPLGQHFLRLLHVEAQKAIFLFLDDFHYLAIDEQPIFLDLIHGITRDNDVWIKAAGIKHQSRWFTDDPPTGLQTRQDASIIDLDVTLENPQKARKFLSDILDTYATEAQLPSVRTPYSSTAIDRLVIAAGGVPRDFLTLSASALQVARERVNARQAGVQDVNEAAGRASKVKITELEEDAASSGGQADRILKVLQYLREFLLNEEKATYFRIDFLDKEQHPLEYSLLQSLMDLRLVHLVHSSLSDEHHAGQRYEVYALDLSQFSGARLKYNLRALDLDNGYLVLRSTGTGKAPKTGNTSRALQGILRRGPVFHLNSLTELLNTQKKLPLQ